MLKQLEGYDWEQAFCVVSGPEPAPNNVDNISLQIFDREDVKIIYGIDEGTNEGSDWIVYGRLKDGRYFCLRAWCDYTGWDCQSGGSCQVANSKKLIEKFGLTKSERERLDLSNDSNV